MSCQPDPDCQSMIPDAPVPPDGAAFSRQMRTLLNGEPNDEAAVARALEGMEPVFDRIATGLYSLASMLCGEGEESVRLVEATVASPEFAACCDPAQARRSGRRALCRLALERIAASDPAALAPPAGLEDVKPCIDGDDLAAAGISGEELERMISGSDREHVKSWLASLPASHRTVFALRAVAGVPSPEAAELLVCHAGPQAASWTPDVVREVFRQALCSLASQLLHASTERA